MNVSAILRVAFVANVFTGSWVTSAMTRHGRGQSKSRVKPITESRGAITFRTCLLIACALFATDFVVAKDENLIAGKRVEANAKLKVGEKLVATYAKKNHLVEVREIQQDGKLQILWLESNEESNNIEPNSLYYIGDAAPTRSPNSSPFAAELSPEAQRLRAKIREAERTAELMAREIEEQRNKSEKRSDAEAAADLAKEKILKILLADTFELKLQLESLQVKELQTRLNRFEDQIRERKERREKIVEYRLKQLIGKSDLHWESSANIIETMDSTPESLRADGNEDSSGPGQSKLEPEEHLPTVLKRYFPDANVQVHLLVNGNVLLTGDVRNVETISRIMDIAQLYAPLVLNHLRIKPDAENRNNGDGVTPSNAVGNEPQKDVRPTIRDTAANTVFELNVMREQLEPFAKKIDAAQDQVHEQEAIYFRDRSNPTALRDALSALDKEIEVFRNQLARFDPLKQRLTNNQMMAALENKKQQARWTTIQQRLNNGDATTSVASGIIEERDAASKKLELANQQLQQFQSIFDKRVVPAGDEGLKNFSRKSATQNYRPDVARAWLEAKTGLKLKLVSCEELKQKFKKVFRVEQPHRGFAADDLIVTFNGYFFDSWSQAVDAAKGQDGNAQMVIGYLHGGLSGPVRFQTFNAKPNAAYEAILKPEQLRPGDNDHKELRSIVKLEIELRMKGVEKSEMHYVTGICLSPQGLVVIPLPEDSIKDHSAIGVRAVDIFGNEKTMSATCVLTDDEHDLGLLKLEPSQPDVFTWMNCRHAMPTLKQKVRVGPELWQCAVMDDRNLPERYVKMNAFVAGAGGTFGQEFGQAGNPIIAFDGDLQGMVIDVINDERVNMPSQLVAVPAVHIAKLLKDYLTNHEKLDD